MQNLDIDETLIGDLLQAPELLPNVRKILGTSESFSRTDCATLYTEMCRQYDDRGNFDIVTLQEAIKRIGLLESDVMGWSIEASALHGLTHAAELVERFIRRVTKATLTEALTGLSTAGDIDECLALVQAKLADMRSMFRRDRVNPISIAAGEILDEIDQIRAGNKLPGIPFGFHDLDRYTGGMDPGDLIVVQAPEKSGKSTLMIQTVFETAKSGKPCLIFSAEMKAKQILYRKACLDTGIRWVDLKNNGLRQEEWEVLVKRVSDLARYPLFVRFGSFTILDIIADAERYVREKGVKLIAVDYIQRVVPISKNANQNREREVAAISSGLKGVALGFDVPVMALSQVNDDLRARESRAIEHDMDKGITIGNQGPQGLQETGYPVPLRIRQRMGISGGFGDVKLWYDLLHGVWRDYSERRPQRAAGGHATKAVADMDSDKGTLPTGDSSFNSIASGGKKETE